MDNDSTKIADHIAGSKNCNIASEMYCHSK